MDIKLPPQCADASTTTPSTEKLGGKPSKQMRDRHYVMMRRCDGPNSDQSQLGAINDSETLLNKDIILHPIEKLVSTEKS